MGTSNRECTPMVNIHFGFGVKPFKNDHIGQWMIMRDLAAAYHESPWMVDGERAKVEVVVTNIAIHNSLDGFCDIELSFYTGGSDPEIESKVPLQVTTTQQNAFERTLGDAIGRYVKSAGTQNSTIFHGAHAEIVFLYRSRTRTICSEQ